MACREREKEAERKRKKDFENFNKRFHQLVIIVALIITRFPVRSTVYLFRPEYDVSYAHSERGCTRKFYERSLGSGLKVACLDSTGKIFT